MKPASPEWTVPRWPTPDLLARARVDSRAGAPQGRVAAVRRRTSGVTEIRSWSGPARPSNISKLVSAVSTRTRWSWSAGGPGRRPTRGARPSRRRWSRAVMTAPTSGSSTARARRRRVAARSAAQNRPKQATNRSSPRRGSGSVNAAGRPARALLAALVDGLPALTQVVRARAHAVRSPPTVSPAVSQTSRPGKLFHGRPGPGLAWAADTGDGRRTPWVDGGGRGSAKTGAGGTDRGDQHGSGHSCTPGAKDQPRGHRPLPGGQRAAGGPDPR